MSFRDIGAILKKASREEQNEKQSSSTRAYQLFSENRTPLQVAIELGLAESETTKYYGEYLNLNQMSELKMIYDEVGDDIAPFLELYKLAKAARMNSEHVAKLLQDSSGYLPMLELKIKRLTKEVDRLGSEKQKLKEAGNQIRVLANVSQKYGDEITNLEKEKRRLETIVKIFRNSNEYKKIKQAAEEAVVNSLSNRKDLLKLAVSCVTETLRKDPDKFYFLVKNDQYVSPQLNFSGIYRALILEDAEKLFELMVRDLISKVIS
jgi:hypothetical protein